MEGGPKLLGIDVVYVATLLAAVASFAVLIAIWGVLTRNSTPLPPGAPEPHLHA